MSRIDLSSLAAQKTLATMLKIRRENEGLVWPTPLIDLEKELVVAIYGHKPPQVAITLDLRPGPTDAVPMTYSFTEAAAELDGVSKRTLSRWVADGRLEKLGRRITAASVERFRR